MKTNNHRPKEHEELERRGFMVLAFNYPYPIRTEDVKINPVDYINLINPIKVTDDFILNELKKLEKMSNGLRKFNRTG